MGNKVTQYDGGTAICDGRGVQEGSHSQALDPTLIRSFMELTNDGDTIELNMEKFQVFDSILFYLYLDCAHLE